MLDKSFSLVLCCTSPTIIFALLFIVCYFDNYLLPCHICTYSSLLILLAVHVRLYSFSMSFKTTILYVKFTLLYDTGTLSIIGLPIELLKLTNESK